MTCKKTKNDHVNDQVNILQLTNNQLAILNLIKQSDQTNDQVNTLSISQKLKLSYSTVKRAIYVLQQNNFIKRIGSDKQWQRPQAKGKLLPPLWQTSPLISRETTLLARLLA